jgi:aminoacylase
MKSVGIQHIEAIYRLKIEEGKRLKRTIHLRFLILLRKFNSQVLKEIKYSCSFVADEELGGREGMELFVLSEKFKALNIGLAIDEGLASPDEVVPLFYGERNVFWVNFHCFGKYFSAEK